MHYQHNSLNFIRLLAALQVFYGHAVIHLSISEPTRLSQVLSLFAGVPIFFFVSGYLMWKSVDRSPNIKQYFTKRVLRLYPELWCGVAVSLISIIILYDNIVPRDICMFAITQSTIVQFWTPESLRGFGVGTPNGSLWTICVLVQFYVLTWFIKRFMNKHNTIVWWLSILTVLTVVNAFSPKIDSIFPEALSKLYGQTFVPYLWLFMLGAFVSEYFERIVPLLRKFWWTFLLAFCAVKFLSIEIQGTYPIFASVFSCAFCLGLAYAFPNIKIKHDLSYGIYIYHMIVLNIALELGFKGSWYVFAVVLVLTVFLSAVSYFTVGALSKKKKMKLTS